MESTRSEGKRGRQRERGRERSTTSAARPTGARGSEVAGWTPLGLGLGVAGIAVAILGLWLVTRGDITAAPLLLVLAYLVLFPLALTR
jgi:hypothetical protein